MLFQPASFKIGIFLPGKILIAGLIVLASNTLESQPVERVIQDKIFHDLPSGLSQKSVNAILQDHRGFMWIGTEDGLNKFDGYSFTIYRHSLSDSSSITHSLVRAIIEDGEKGLWIGPERGGLNYYDFETDRFSAFDSNLGNGNLLSNSTIYDLMTDEESMLWIATNHGLALFDVANYKFQTSSLLPSSLIDLDVHVLDLFLDRRGTVWIGTENDGLWSFNREQNKLDHYEEGNSGSGILGNGIRVTYESEGGIIWIGTNKGLNRYDAYNQKFLAHPALKGTDVWAIAESVNNEIIVGTDGDGLKLISPNDRLQSYFPSDIERYSLNDNVIRNLYKDSQGNVWIGMFRGGINLIHNQASKFSVIKKGNGGLSNGSVLSIAKNDSSGLWIGTDGGGLNRLDFTSGVITKNDRSRSNWNPESDNVILSIMEDHEGALWTGTYNGGLKYYSAKSNKVVRFQTDNSELINNSVLAIHQDKNRNVWIGTNGGINYYKWESKSLERIASRSSRSLIDHENSVRTIFEDSKGNLWFGIMGGVKRINYETMELKDFIFDGNQRNYLIFSIHEDSNSDFWLGTFGGGLLKFNPERGIIKRYETSDGLPSDIIHGILEDSEHNLWLSTGTGLSKFNPVTGQFRNYGVDDGLQADQFNRAAYLADDSDYFWFGGINGLNVFHPDSIFNNLYVPPVVFTNLKVFNQSVNQIDMAQFLDTHVNSARKIELEYSHSVFTIEFASLNYVFPARNQYSFFLEGFDTKWRGASNRREATYTNLDPGVYTFRVKSSNNDGVWNETPASIDIIMYPPWWRTWWALSLYFTVSAIVLIWARQLIVHRERLKISSKMDHLELVHLQEMDHMKSRFFANISHELRTPLTLILDPLRLMYDREAHPKVQKQLKTMIRNAQRLVRLINQLLDLSKLETGNMKLDGSQADLVQWFKQMLPAFSSFADQHNIRFNIDLTSKTIITIFDQDKFEKVVSNLLSNSFKFTRDNGSIALSVKKVDKKNLPYTPKEDYDDWVEIKVIDDGVGIPEDQIKFVFDRFYQVDGIHHREQEGTGIGLSLTKELVELHQGQIVVDSEEGKGTSVRVFIPIVAEEQSATIVTSIDDTSQQRLFNQIESTVGIGLPDTASAIAGKSAPLLLVVEDNPDVSAYICDKLGDDFRTSEALNGKSGFEMAVRLVPDLIISDVMMPEMDGIEMTTLLKKDQRTSHIPIILLTAKAEDQDIFKGIDVGADDYIVKPFDSRLLAIRVKNIIESRAKLKSTFSNNRVINLEPKKITATPVDELFLKKALESVEKNMSNSDYSVENFGNDVGLSRMQLYRKLKGLTDRSPNEFIRTVRLKRAAQLIHLDQMTISQITYEVGFNDLQYFRVCFKKQFGLNPSDYGKVPSDMST